MGEVHDKRSVTQSKWTQVTKDVGSHPSVRSGEKQSGEVSAMLCVDAV